MCCSSNFFLLVTQVMTTHHYWSELVTWPYSQLVDRSPLWMNDSIPPRCEEICCHLVEKWGFMWNRKTAESEANDSGPRLDLSRGASLCEASKSHLHLWVSPFNKHQSLCDRFKAQRWTRRAKLLGICNYLLPVFSHSHHCSGSAGLALEIMDLKHPSTIIKTPWYWHRNGQANQ